MEFKDERIVDRSVGPVGWHVHHGRSRYRVDLSQTWWTAVDMKQDREDEVCKDSGRPRIQVEDDTEDDVQGDVRMDEWSSNPIYHIDHNVKA